MQKEREIVDLTHLFDNEILELLGVSFPHQEAKVVDGFENVTSYVTSYSIYEGFACVTYIVKRVSDGKFFKGTVEFTRDYKEVSYKLEEVFEEPSVKYV